MLETIPNDDVDYNMFQENNVDLMIYIEDNDRKIILFLIWFRIIQNIHFIPYMKQNDNDYHHRMVHVFLLLCFFNLFNNVNVDKKI